MLVINRMAGVNNAVNVHPHLRIALPETKREVMVATNPIIETMWFM